MKIKLNLDDGLPLNIIIEISSMAIVASVIFMKMKNMIDKFA